ncbi:MAG: DUF1573 domain-containing protein [Candidatus Omnitrophota bacterium]
MKKLRLSVLFILWLLFSIVGCYSGSTVKSSSLTMSGRENPPKQAQTVIPQQTPAQNNSQDTDDDLKVDNARVWDFGKAKAGVILEHVFLLKNESAEKTLNINDLTTSCGCTVSEAAKKTLLPGETAEIEVKFNTKGYVGQTKQFIIVTTDNLDNSVIQFIIKADVEK